jgi:hypothetical protein
MESSSASSAGGEFDPPADLDNWLDLIDYLTSELAEREEVIECELEGVTLDVPMQMHADADTARWRFDGGVRVSFGEVQVPLRAWLQYWEQAE